MDKSFRRPGSATQQPGVLSAGLRIVGRLLHWMTGFFQLTEDERRDAGIYIGGTVTSDTWSDELT
jgi:hypothetical protein